MPDPILIGIHGMKRVGESITADFIREFAEELDPALSVVQVHAYETHTWD